MWIKRDLSQKVLKKIRTRPVVLLTGARQTGKSSLLKELFPETQYITFDHLNQIEAAKDSPNYFLNQFINPVILDEIQYVPELFRELKIFIDNDRHNYGKWILTGSQRFELMENVSESLAGRIGLINLETLSANELRSSNHLNLKDHLWKGGYPEIWSHPDIDVHDFFESYIRTYIERDLKQLIEVRNLNDFRRLIKTLAVRTGQLINYQDISNNIGVSAVTVKKWVHALEMSGLIILLPPYFSNIGKRLVKSPKMYFSDHGLACHLLGVNTADDWHNHPQRGNLWENFVLMELIKTNMLIPGQEIFFYRDQNGVEIDFIIEVGEKLHFVEAKASERVDPGKLNFKKVVPLFQENHSVRSIVAHNGIDKNLIKRKAWQSFNPLHYHYRFR